MSSYQKPTHLQPGDAIGIVSPSSTIEFFPKRLERSIKALQQLGFQVRLGANSTKTYGKAAGTPAERAKDINDFFGDPSIKAILGSTGGYNANAVLPLLDYELIAKNPKIFCGYSDITALNLALTAKARMVTFNGPTLLPSFGEFGGPFPFTIEQFKKTLCNTEPLGVLAASDTFSDENLWWEKEDTRPSRSKPANATYALNGGTAEGTLMGGNLETVTMLGGTEYMPDFKGCILFLEELGGSTDLVERNLAYLEQLGIFDDINGFIYGRPYQFEDDKARPLRVILADFAKRHNLPAIVDIDCGHTNPMLTMPIGVNAKLDADRATIEIIESAVL